MSIRLVVAAMLVAMMSISASSASAWQTPASRKKEVPGSQKKEAKNANSDQAGQDDTKKEATEKESTDEPILGIGSTAPALNIEHWVSRGGFDEVTTFEDGKVYIVEFWATWCPPCVRAMPHISSLQKEYADKDLQVISVSDEDLETVQEFLKRKVRGQKEITYGELTSNYCLTTDPDGSVNDDYMKAALENGIPTAFVVGKTGQIEWIGHPMKIDEPIQQVIEDKWDREAAKIKRAAKVQENKKAMAERRMMSEIINLADAGKMDTAIEKLSTIIDKAEGDQKQNLQFLKFQMMASEEMEGADAVLASIVEGEENTGVLLRIAAIIVGMNSNGIKISDNAIQTARTTTDKVVAKEPSAIAMGLQAKLAYMQGSLGEAIEIQTKAIGEAEGELKKEFESFLADLNEEEKSEESKETPDSKADAIDEKSSDAKDAPE